jgi:hypothetical protein
MLSPRVLLFGFRDILWQCQTVIAKPLLGSTDTYFLDVSRLPPESFGVYFSLAPGTAETQASKWATVINAYSGRKVTFAEDRLPAIAGIVQELGRVWKGNYLAGHWKNCLVPYLGRRVNKPMSRTSSRPSFGPPSWSWLSIDGPVKIDRYDVIDEEEARVFDCTVDLVDSDEPFGEIRGGTLVLSGATIPASDLPEDHMELFMDYDDIKFKDTGCICVELGQGYNRQGLIVMQAGDDNYKRVGYWRHKADDIVVEGRWLRVPYESLTII